MGQTVANQEILDWVAGDTADPIQFTELALPNGKPEVVTVGQHYLDVACAIGQRLLDLRQELALQDEPATDEVYILEKAIEACGGLPYEVWRRVDVPPFFSGYRWQLLARCVGVDPDLFFPERGASIAEAKEVCHGCVVKDECLELGLEPDNKFGIFGGKSERERRRIRRTRALATGLGKA